MGDELEDLHDRFMSGGCHALALVLSERTGWPMLGLWLRRGRREEIAHVVVLPPGDGDPGGGMREFLDVGGLRGLPEILLDLDAEEDERLRFEELDAAAVRRMTSPSRPAHRKLPELSPGLMGEAEEAACLVLASEGLGEGPPGP